MLDILEGIKGRFSARAFLEKEVTLDVIENILDCARFAPSGVNTQPWHVSVLGPNTRSKISKAFIEAREAGVEPDPDYQYYPDTWFEPYKSRRFKCGAALYGALNISHEDKEKRKIQWYKNYYFFNAPCAMLIWIDKRMCKGSWLDLGMFIQNIALACRGHGLECCAQASMAEYPNHVRRILNFTDDKILVCGLSIGYADYHDPVNQYRTERLNINEFTDWFLD